MLSITRLNWRRVILLTLLILPTTLFAATITVNVNTDDTGAAEECELRDAILAAHFNAPREGRRL